MPPRARTAAPTGATGADAGVRLVIVESPAKARTIAGYLGDGYLVESSIGHIRDLPRNAADVPADVKGKSWARLGVDVDNGFEPLYIVTADKKSQVAKLKSLLKEATELFLATDEDREGEAIAWHLLQTLKPRVPVRRMVFHEITPQAIQAAVANPREIDERLVDAQETRRILDRLYGYEVSPVLWKKVMPRLSAGRVQSVATRILVERERARMRFRAAGYWDIDGLFGAGSDESIPLPATLVAVGDARVATGRDFDATGNLTTAGARQLDETAARALVDGLAGAGFTVSSVEERPYRRSPYAPFMTSTLQQEAGRKLRFSSQRTMQIAQRLYENGFITYMRTDSTALSQTAVDAARSQARQLYGPEYVPERPRSYTRKVKNAQEAHEAIRPAGDSFRTPGQLAGQLGSDEFRLYELIWQRTVASQMSDAVGTSATVRLTAPVASGPDAGRTATFQASGKVITFPGFLRAYVEGSDDPDAELEDRERRLPQVREGDRLTTRELTPRGHTTSPPARYTEASLVKTMEELGIGRPSTYASILGTIVDRGYAWRKASALVPTWLAFAVVQLLEAHFARLVDYRFTSSVEDDLDEIASGSRESTEWLTRFYFGAAGAPNEAQDAVPIDDSDNEGGMARAGGLKLLVESRLADIDAREVNSIPIGTTPDGEPILVRVGRYGPYVSVGSGDETSRASLPDDLAPDELTPERALDLLAQPSGDRDLGIDPTTGEPVTLKIGRYGPYVERGLPPEQAASAPAENGKPAKKAAKAAKSAAAAPTRTSLFKDMDPATVTLADVLPLLELPRTLGADPTSGEPITAQNGRYGPYVKRGSDSRSLGSEPELLTVTLEQALALLAQPKARSRAAAAPPLRELGDDPVSQKPMVIKEGRFGPYVTDGETNASLRKGDEIATITAERASELLADRRARGPAPSKSRRTPAKKAPAKRAPVKKATKATKATRARKS